MTFFGGIGWNLISSAGPDDCAFKCGQTIGCTAWTLSKRCVSSFFPSLAFWVSGYQPQRKNGWSHHVNIQQQLLLAEKDEQRQSSKRRFSSGETLQGWVFRIHQKLSCIFWHKTQWKFSFKKKSLWAAPSAGTFKKRNFFCCTNPDTWWNRLTKKVVKQCFCV